MDYYGDSNKRIPSKIKDGFPDAARFIDACWTLLPPGPQTPRDRTVNFWIYPCRQAPDVSRVFAVLNEIIDQVPGAIIYVEEACRKFVNRMPKVNPNRPFADEVLMKIWPVETKRRVILRELEKACDQALNPSFGFDDDLADFGGAGSGSGPANGISAAVQAAVGSRGGNS